MAIIDDKVKDDLIQKVQELKKFKQQLLDFERKSKEILERLSDLEEVEALINLLRGIAKIFVANYRKETLAQDASL